MLTLSNGIFITSHIYNFWYKFMVSESITSDFDSKGIYISLINLINMEGFTTITIKRETKAKLDKLGKKNESYEDLVKRLIEMVPR